MATVLSVSVFLDFVGRLIGSYIVHFVGQLEYVSCACNCAHVYMYLCFSNIAHTMNLHFQKQNI